MPNDMELYVFATKHEASTNLVLNNSLLSNPESSCIVLVGDFNIPSISWSDNDSTPITSGGCPNGEILCELIRDNFLQQFVISPTHSAGNKLDLLFCNCAESISNVLTSPADEHNFPTDHYVIEFIVFVPSFHKRNLCDASFTTIATLTSLLYAEPCREHL